MLEKYFYDNNRLNKNKLKESWVKKNLPELWENVNKFTQTETNISYSQKLYNYLNDLNEIPLCEYCKNKEKRFIGFSSGYNNFCSKSCASKSSSKKGQETRKIKTLEKYGVEHTSQLESVKDKNKQTCLEKYGVEHATQLDSVKEKQIKTFTKKYGVEYSFQSEIIKEKIKQTCLERYGVENPAKSKEITIKMIKNGEYHICTEEIKEKSLQTKNNKRLKELKELYPELEILSLSRDNMVSIFCKRCEKEYQIKTYLLYLRKQRYKSETCLYCNPIKEFKSSYEKEIEEFLKNNNNGEILIKNKSLIHPFELDVYLPEFKIALEVNGLYWHSELEKNKNYHLEKTKMCEGKGVRLIHIWEDQWLYKKDIIKSMILGLLNKNNKIILNNYQIKELKNVDDFLNLNHLQGNILSSVSLGLFKDEELLSLISFKKVKDKHVLVRFCDKINLVVENSCNILFDFFIKNYNFSEIIGYESRDLNDINSSVFQRLGFQFKKYTKPNYWWAKDTFRFKKYKPVKEMLSNGYYRIFDSGNLIFNYKPLKTSVKVI